MTTGDITPKEVTQIAIDTRYAFQHCVEENYRRKANQWLENNPDKMPRTLGEVNDWMERLMDTYPVPPKVDGFYPEEYLFKLHMTAELLAGLAMAFEKEDKG